jgi:hypothetical protein
LRIWWPKTKSNKELWEKHSKYQLAVKLKWENGNVLGTLWERIRITSLDRDLLNWNPQGKRWKGGPRVTWKRTVLAELQEQNVSWNEAKQMAKKRIYWRKFVKPLCST